MGTTSHNCSYGLAKETRETASSNHRRAQGTAKELRRPERLIQGAGRLYKIAGQTRGCQNGHPKSGRHRRIGKASKGKPGEVSDSKG